MEKRSLSISVQRPCPSEEIIEWASRFPEFLGAYEGSEQPKTRVLDGGLMPQDRRVLSDEPLQIYFSELKIAEDFLVSVQEKFGPLSTALHSEIPQDWNAEWKKSFQGVDILPHWSIRPTWASDQDAPAKYLIRLDPSTGFGSGTHPTTQMLLHRVGELHLCKESRVLDFGAGSGILAIAAALRGAMVVAVEIDAMAIEAAKEAARLNGVLDRIHFVTNLSEVSNEDFDLCLANILRSILVAHARQLRGAVKRGGPLFLSGLLEDDLPDIQEAFGPLKSIDSKDEWRAVEV